MFAVFKDTDSTDFKSYATKSIGKKQWLFSFSVGTITNELILIS